MPVYLLILLILCRVFSPPTVKVRLPVLQKLFSKINFITNYPQFHHVFGNIRKLVLSLPT